MAVESFTPAPTARPPRGGRRSMEVYHRLQRDIVLGALAPGTALLELELAQRFACSQGTIREALLLLQEEGLVVRVQHRGTHVSESRRDDALELLHLRHDIECRAVDRVLARYDRSLRAALLGRIEAMRAAARADDEYLLSQHDRDFHLSLHAAAGLPSVQPILQRCLIHNHRYKILTTSRTAGRTASRTAGGAASRTVPGGRDLYDTAERHVAIIQALDTGDAAQASAALSHHIATIVDFGPRLDRPFDEPRLAWPPEAP